LENKFVWIENIKSFSGRHRLRGDSAVGSSLWYPDFFEETQKIYLAKPGERVYHFLNMENMLGFSTISSGHKRQKYKTKAQKRVAYLEGMARGIKVCVRNDLSQTISLRLTEHKRLNEAFSLDKALTSKGSLGEFMALEYKEEFEYLVEELSKGSSLIRLSFSFWLFVVSFRSSTI